ncbi:MAG TPA: transglutaminaseTgpA domain-containing protein [Gaiellaceae bacterium]|nr:transglutaminaseTgpA domain-containing protein [Gaiellaceae bacterium]
MARTALLFVLSGALIAAAWLRLESGSVAVGDVLPVLALAFVPAVAVAAGLRRLYVGGLTAAVTLAACSQVFDRPVTDARPGGEHDFFGPVLGSFRDGFLSFYDTTLPFRRGDFPLMHADVLLAVFGFALAAGILIAARRPIGAAVALVVGVGWPTTLVPGPRPLLVGALAFAGVLAVLFLLRSGTRPARGLAQGVAVALALVAVAAAASTSDSVAKGAFLTWQGWDPYDQPDDPVGVRYVWNSHYLGIHFPKKKTTVLKIKTEGTKRNLYWRATTLDDYTGNGWQESLDLGPATESGEIDSDTAALLPAVARNPSKWVKQEVTVEALRDNHLIGSAQPMRWTPPSDAAFQDESGDVVVLTRSLQRNQTYSVSSYVPRPTERQLGRAGTNYPASMERYLEVIQTVGVPKFGTPNRDAAMGILFDVRYADDPLMQANRPLYDAARQVVGDVQSPYAAAAALEAWFRQPSLGGFVYDEQPPVPPNGTPALVQFVTQTKRGYCQHFAGAMTLMLRYLGIPARVAAGFTSGTYDADKHEWTVTDHEAHDWVEVYFPGWGWIPFDPTPGRGTLDAPYSSSSAEFDGAAFSDVTGPGGRGSSDTIDALLAQEKGRPGQESSGIGNARGGGATAVVRDKGPSIVVLAFFVIMAAALVVVGLKTVRRSLRFAGRDPRVLAGACRRDLMAFLADQGVEVQPSATLAELGYLVERYFAVDAAPFVRAATVARFGRPQEAAVALARARRELRRVRRDMRNRINLTSRLRGAVSLRSLSV